MAILNVTPDSFSDGGRYNQSIDQSINQAISLIDAGADWIDIGGMSTRPGASDVSINEEIDRVSPAIRQLIDRFPKVIVSIDTFNYLTAKQAIDDGASIVNDVTGGNDRQLVDLVGQLQIPYAIMHMRGNPSNMQKLNQYTDLIEDVRKELNHSINRALDRGVARWNIIVDPGIGFAKNGKQNIQLIDRLMDCLPDRLMPVLVGTSRKRFLANIVMNYRNAYQSINQSVHQSNNQASNPIDNESRDWATAATNTICISHGVDILRVHRVQGIRENIAVADAVYRPKVNRYK